MAQFNFSLNNDVLRQFQALEKNANQMFGEMTKAGADVVEKHLRANLKKSFKDTTGIESCLKVTRTYKMPKAGAIATSVMIDGYFVNRQGKTVPAPLVANAREYGTVRGEKKIPFLRPAFNRKGEIEKAMLKVQEKYIGGDNK